MTNLDTSQQRILNSARDLIYSRSYSDVGVAEICEHAGVQKGSFYHFFASKRDLTLAVLDIYFTIAKEQLVDKAFATDLSPLARLDRFAKLTYKFQVQTMRDTGRVLGCPIGNLATELATQDEAIRTKISHLFTELQASIRQVVKDAVKAGELVDVNIEATAQAMLAYFEGVLLLAKTQNDPEVVRQLLPAIAHVHIPKRR
jgi:TetR/AcrR family transcriptional repressor of nem operon